MGNYTEELDLFLTDMNTDGNDYFNFNRDLTENFIKIDNFAVNTRIHKDNTNNPHAVTKAQVGLGNVDNTSDLNKPISTAVQTALNAKADDSNAVHKTGNENIDGVKNFFKDIYIENNRPRFITKNSNYYWNNNFEANTVFGENLFLDAASRVIGGVQSEASVNVHHTLLFTYNKDFSASAGIYIGYDNNNNLFTSAPTPVNINDNSNQIATTAWVNNFRTASKSFISNCAMPSTNRYNVAVGASGTTYTAPADGFFFVEAWGVGILLYNITSNIRQEIQPNNYEAEIATFMPCAQGDTIKLIYQGDGHIDQFQFIYAKGAI